EQGMENRGAQHRRERLADALRDEIGAILEGDLADPRIGLATVSEVVLAADGKSASAVISVEGSQQDAEETLAGLNAAKGFIRHELLERLGRKHVPEIFFYLDHSSQFGGRVEELLKRIKKRR